MYGFLCAGVALTAFTSCHNHEQDCRQNQVQLSTQESMRIYPAGAVATTRKNISQQDAVLMGEGCKVVVPPGVELFMPVYAVMRLESNWPDPDRFLPERWLEVCILLLCSWAE